MVRRILGIVAGAAVGALGALLLGEYPFSGVLVLAAGLVLGLFVAETVVGITRERGLFAAAPAAAIAGAGLLWGAWISGGHDLGRLPAEGWGAVALAMMAAAVRARSSSKAADHQPASAPPT